jgi:hypothetical protein
MTTRTKVWFALRGLLVVVAAVAIALWARQGTFWLVVSASSLCAVAVLLYVLGLIGRLRFLPHSPSTALPLLELEVAGQVVGVIFLYASAIYLLAWLSEELDTYLIGVASGAVIGFLSGAFLKAVEDESWVGAHVQRVLVGKYKPLFLQRSEKGELVGESPAVWEPDGKEADALQKPRYKVDGAWVGGWGWKARRRRIDTLMARLPKKAGSMSDEGTPRGGSEQR